MEEVRGKVQDQTLTIFLSGRIDSGNAAEVEEKIGEILDSEPGCDLIVDMSELEYISSAGLRILLRLRKSRGGLHLIGVSSEVFEILEMTGFTELMDVEKAYRSVSIDGCEVIGQGANGTVYRIDGDNVVKVYNDADALDDIHHEREVARLALVLGVPTAISYDVVRVGECYGSVFELLNARSFSKILSSEPEKIQWCVKEYVDLLKRIHSTVVPKGKLPDMRKIAIDWAEFVQEYLPEEAGRKLKALIENVPEDDHMVHGDYHTKNIQLSGDEVLLIDMDTLATGHPIFELASMFNAFVGFGESDPAKTTEFMGFDYEVARRFWHDCLAEYLGTKDEDRIREVADKARIVGYTRLIRRSIRRQGLETEEGRQEIELWKTHLLELLDKVDSLLFLRNELRVEATNKNLQKVMSFVNAHLEEALCPPKKQMEVEVAVEEIYVNIANYAYENRKGYATINVDTAADKSAITITMRDTGRPFDPLEREDPDTTLSASERDIGGLGIFMTRQMMDEVDYEYVDGMNILTMKKILRDEK